MSKVAEARAGAHEGRSGSGQEGGRSSSTGERHHRRRTARGRWASNLAAATALLLVDALSRRDGRRLAGARCCRARAHPVIWRQYGSYMKDYRAPVLDLLRHCQECLLDVGGVLRRRLEEGDGKLVREFLVKG